MAGISRWLFALALAAAVGVLGVKAGQDISPILGAGFLAAALVIFVGLILPPPVRLRRLVVLLLLVVGLPPLAIGLLQVSTWYGPRPAPTEQALFKGSTTSAKYHSNASGRAHPKVDLHDAGSPGVSHPAGLPR